MDKQATEQKAAKILLKRGVKVPVTAPLFLRLFGKKSINVTVKAPTTNTLLMVADKFLSLRITETKDLSLTEAFELYKKHSRKMTEIVTLCILNSPAKVWRHKILARFLEWKLQPDEITYLFHLIIAYGGVQDFINTIRFAETIRITKPMNLSQKKKKKTS